MYKKAFLAVEDLLDNNTDDLELTPVNSPELVKLAFNWSTLFKAVSKNLKGVVRGEHPNPLSMRKKQRELERMKALRQRLSKSKWTYTKKSLRSAGEELKTGIGGVYTRLTSPNAKWSTRMKGSVKSYFGGWRRAGQAMLSTTLRMPNGFRKKVLRGTGTLLAEAPALTGVAIPTLALAGTTKLLTGKKKKKKD